MNFNIKLLTSVCGQVLSKGVILGRPDKVDQKDYRGETVEVMLSRQGCADVLNVSHPAFFLEFRLGKKVHCQVCYSSGDEGQRRYGFHYNGQVIRQFESVSFNMAKNMAKKALKAELGIDLVILDEIRQYCHSMGDIYGYQSKDVEVSRVAFIPETNEIVDLFYNRVLVSFPATTLGHLNLRVRDKENITKVKELVQSYDWCGVSYDHYDIPAMIARTAKGFHDCDYKSGYDHSMKRFAWLLNAYIQEADRKADKKSGIYFIINRDMTLPKKCLTK